MESLPLTSKCHRLQRDSHHEYRSSAKPTWVGGFNPSEKYESIRMIIPNIWDNEKCSKPPTSCRFLWLFSGSDDWKQPPKTKQMDEDGQRNIWLVRIVLVQFHLAIHYSKRIVHFLAVISEYETLTWELLKIELPQNHWFQDLTGLMTWMI